MAVMHQHGRRRQLLIGTFAFVLVTIVIAPLVGRLLNSLAAVLLLFAFYWSGILALSVLAAPRSSLVALYRTRVNRRPLEFVLTWLPVAGTFLSVFLPSASHMPVVAWAAIVGVAIVNGLIEELFWRGTFVSMFPENLLLAYVYPSVLFAAWHVALALLPDVHYPHGPIALIGGGTVLGFAWGWVAWRTRDLRSVSVAHVLTNTFAFGGPVLMTWADSATG
jgi:uncharacterized protein